MFYTARNILETFVLLFSAIRAIHLNNALRL